MSEQTYDRESVVAAINAIPETEREPLLAYIHSFIEIANTARETIERQTASLAAATDTINKLVEQNKRKAKVMGLVKEALDQLRVDIKYLAFDLEATRRERDEALEKLRKYE